MVSKKNKREKKAANKRFVDPAGEYVPSGANELTGGFYVPTGDYIPTGGYMPTGDYEQYGLYVPTGDYIPTGGYVPAGDYELYGTRRVSAENLFEESHIEPIFLLKNNPYKLSSPKGYIIPPIILF